MDVSYISDRTIITTGHLLKFRMALVLFDGMQLQVQTAACLYTI